MVPRCVMDMTFYTTGEQDAMNFYVFIASKIRRIRFVVAADVPVGYYVAVASENGGWWQCWADGSEELLRKLTR